MSLIKTVNNISPKFGKNCYLADNATIIGDVVMGNDCSVWFNAVIRGDVHFVRIGNRTNIQDGVIIHCTYQKASVTIGNDVSIAHNATVHGCTIADNVLIGMNAVIMDNAKVNENTIIAAGSVILENSILEPNSVYAGLPAKKIKQLDKNLSVNTLKRISAAYLKYSSWYKK